MAINVLTATVTGALSAPSQVVSSETINGNLVALGGKLMVNNASGSPVNVTIADPGRTGLGNTGTNAAQAVATATSKLFKLTDAMVDSATGNITVGFSATGATITAQIIV